MRPDRGSRSSGVLGDNAGGGVKKRREEERERKKRNLDLQNTRQNLNEVEIRL